jgi:hypothetical protein
MLRTIHISSKETARLLRCADQTVSNVENWFRKEDYGRIAGSLKDEDLKQIVAIELTYLEISPQNIAKLAGLTRDDILREYRGAEYLHTQRMPDARAQRHFDELAQVASTLYEVQQFIRSYKGRETFSVVEYSGTVGFFAFQPPPRRQPILSAFSGNSVSVDYPQVEHLFQHLLQEWPDLGLQDWRGLVNTSLSEDVVNRLGYLGNTAKFVFCLKCQVCRDLMT